MTRLRVILLLLVPALAAPDECGRSVPLSEIYAEKADECGVEATMSAECPHRTEAMEDPCAAAIDAMTCEDVVAGVIPEVCRNACW